MTIEDAKNVLPKVELVELPSYASSTRGFY